MSEKRFAKKRCRPDVCTSCQKVQGFCDETDLLRSPRLGCPQLGSDPNLNFGRNSKLTGTAAPFTESANRGKP